MASEQYLDEFTVGQKFGSGRIAIDESAIKRFAADFDPQPFHLDDEAAQRTLFQGLAASGWHTAALTMKLLVESEFKPAGGIVGAGLEQVTWPRPTRPGDELHLETEIVEIRPSKSRPEQGIVKVRVTTLNQKEEILQMYVGSLVVKRLAIS